MRRAVLFTICAVLVLAAGCSKTKREDLVVATVDTRKITVADFERNTGLLDESYLPENDDLAAKEELLQHMINRQVMGLKAIAMGYDKDPEFIKLWDQFRGPFLITQLMDQFARKPVKVTKKEVDDYFNEMHYEYTLSQIVVPNEEEAIELRHRIVDEGEDFAEVAKKYSFGAEAANGGYVGSEVIGRMHWWVEEDLFKMKEGDVSQPLRTSTGYALLKVMRKRKIIPDLDREYAENRVRAIKEKKNMQDLKAKIEKEIGLVFYPDAVNIAYDALPEDISMESIFTYKVDRQSAPKLNIPEQYRDMLICQYEDGAYTLADFEELYEQYGLPERPRREKGREDIIYSIHKKIFDTILPDYAEQKAKILEIPEVREVYDKRKEHFMVTFLYSDQVRDEISATDREVQEFYNENKDSLQTKDKRDYSIILVQTKDKADELAKLAAEGKDFSVLARKFSLDPTSKDNLGRTGLVEFGKYPEYDMVAFSLKKPGSISDPFQTSRGWAVVRLEEIEKGELPTFEEVKSNLRKVLLEQKAEKHLNEKLEEWRKTYKIEINEENLAKARIIRERPYVPDKQ